MRRLYGTLLIFTLSILFSCQREVSHIGNPDPEVIVPVLPDPITSVLQGNVFDESGNPAAGVSIQVGSKTAITNANGYFRINDAALDKNASLVTATKAGYFKAFRSFSANSGANHIEIKLLKKTVAGTIAAAGGGEVSLANGSKIALPANGIVNAASGAAYTGTVNVYATYIDPTASDINQTVPGSFMANNKEGRRVLLASYGMVAVELESATGEKLQIKSGNTATLITTIPASVQGSAPATIPMWYVDEATGLWKEEGSATKNGNSYVAEVKHFTYWNCDLQVSTIPFTALFQTSTGQPLVNASIVIRPAGTTYGATAHGFTDSLGRASGPIPANTNLVLEVRQYGQGACNNAVIYSQNIGPFTQATNLGTITIPASTNAIVTVQGKLLNCSNTPVTAGFAVVSFGYYTHYARVNASGDFQTTFTQCSSGPSSVSITGVDSTTQQQSVSATTVAITAPTTNAGNIVACGISSTQFINFTLDGNSYNLVNPVDSLLGFTTRQGATLYNTSLQGFRMTSNSGTPSINFSFQSPAEVAGTYNMTFLRVNNLDSIITSTPIPVIITNFPTAGLQFYEGSFTGSFTAGFPAITHTISGNFKIKRRP